MRQVFLDHQSSTPVLPEAVEAMRPFLTEHFGAPASLHHHGLRARDALDAARGQFARLIGAESPESIIFTSGATEAANLAIKGTALARRRQGNHIIVSATEHLCVLNSVAALESQGLAVTRLPVDQQGRLNPADVRAALTPQTILICVHQVNHELGTIQPVAEIGRIAAERGITFFVDAVASGGWLPVDVRELGATLLSLSPHRFYGPKGVGIFYRQARTPLEGILHGGSQEGGRRAGTENVPAIVGAGVAAEIAVRELPRRIAHTKSLQEYLWRGLAARIPHLQLNGPAPGPDRITTNLNVSFEFIEGEAVLLLGDMQGLAMASGPACLSRAMKVSHVLEAIGLDHGLALGNILLTLGKDNTAEEMDYALDVLPKIVHKLRGMSPLWDEFQRGGIASVIPACPGGAVQNRVQ